MTRWGFLRTLSLIAMGFCGMSAIAFALDGDGSRAVTMGVLAIINAGLYMTASRNP